MYLKYLKYLLRHKWFVMLECFKHGMIWQGIVHDWSKFLPDEMIPYAKFFYGGDKRKDAFYTPSQGTNDFNIAWLKHQHRNPHHWQHWVLQEDDGDKFPLPMPRKYVFEMVCDWRGAGKASGNPDTPAWYLRNKNRMILHSSTRTLAEALLGVYV